MSCGPQRLDVLDLGGLRRIPQIYRTLSIEPKFRRVAEQSCEPKSHTGTHGSPPSELVDGLGETPMASARPEALSA